MYLVSQYSTEAPLYVTTPFNRWRSTQLIADCQILNAKRQKNEFPQVLTIFITTMI